MPPEKITPMELATGINDGILLIPLLTTGALKTTWGPGTFSGVSLFF